MDHSQAPLFSAEKITLADPGNGLLELGFGPQSVQMSVDTALDFQFRLAEFLAAVEQGQDGGENYFEEAAGRTDAGLRLVVVPRP